MALFLIILIPAVLLVGGLAVDISQLNAQKLYLQGQADLAAQSAATRLSDLDASRALAQETVSRNNQYGNIVLEEDDVIFGTYSPENGFEPAADQSAPAGVNAVKVDVAMPWHAFLWSAIVPRDQSIITRSAVSATEGTYAAFTLRNRLLTVDTSESPLLAPVLDGLLGVDGLGIDLDVLGYAGLTNADVNINDLLGLVTLGVAADVVTFNDVLNATIDSAELIGDLLTAGGADPAAYTPGASSMISLGQLLQLSPALTSLHVGDALPDLNIGLADLLTATAGLAGSDPTERLSVDLGLNLAPLANVQLETGLIRAPVTFAGPITEEEPLTGEISQVDVSLRTQIASLLNLQLGLSAADATATLTEINCAASEPDDIVARFNVTSAPASLGLRLSLLTPIDSDDAEEDITTPLAPHTQTVEIRLDQLGEPVPVPGQITLSGLTASLANVLDGLTDNIQDNRDEAEAERWQQCPLLLGCILNAVVQALDAVISQLTNVLNQVAYLVASIIPLDELAEGLLTLLGIDTARVDIILNDYTCQGSGVKLVN